MRHGIGSTTHKQLAVLPLYALALFASALLSFWIQPLFAKLILPRYGGSPAVWTTAALFFQVTLLAGYLYAHLIARLPVGRQLTLHAVLFAAAMIALPVQVANIDPTVTAPVVSVLSVLALSIGLPVFALSATAPLLQEWFSRTGHSHAADPYFLYSASNTGSLAALIGYPLVFEPLLGLRQQTILWSAGYAFFAVVLVLCGVALWRKKSFSAAAAASSENAAPEALLTAGTRVRWLLLAFAPSSLMLGVTQHITSEIAAVPLLWLIPLTIYVLTFVIAFARRQWLSPRLIGRVQPLLVILLVLAWPLNNLTSVLILHLVVFAVTAMMCHAELARLRPPVRHLTDFYLCLAIGGALGGAFNAVAPIVFDSILEYPIALALASALRPVNRESSALPLELRGSERERNTWNWQRASRDLLPALALAAGFAVLIASDVRPFTHSAWTTVVYLQAIGIALYLTHRRPLQFGLAVLVVLLATPAVHSAERLIERHRSFFGVHSVVRDETDTFTVLMHGVTVHGAQYRDAARRTRPTTYFHADSPVGQALAQLGGNGELRRVAVIGMGAGTLACHKAPGRTWTFFEIDPLVVQLAKDRRHFQFLSECAPDARIVLGDGRLSLAGEPERAFDAILIDTFSSDSIPAHMITREALALYLSRLDANGVIVFHVTNQYLDLVPVVSSLVADAGVAALMPGPRLEFALDERLAALPSTWIAIARDPKRLEALAEQENWQPLPPPRLRVWTDDFSNVLSALK